MKALMPVIVSIVGLKAMKALFLSKLAITLVLGFLIFQLVKKAGMKMAMNPMQPMPSPPPSSEYGAPIPSASPLSSYEPISSSSWEPSNAQYNSRVWESPSATSSHGLAYSAYYGQPSYSAPSYSSSSYKAKDSGSQTESAASSNLKATNQSSSGSSITSKAY